MENMGNKNLVGKKIKEIRDELNMTQQALVAKMEELGVSIKVSTLSKIETQKRGVTDIELVALSNAMNVEIGDLFK